MEKILSIVQGISPLNGSPFVVVQFEGPTTKPHYFTTEKESTKFLNNLLEECKDNFSQMKTVASWESIGYERIN